MNTVVLFRAILVGLMALSLHPLAMADFTATPEETKMCVATIWNRQVHGDQNWSHVHHYCDCVRFTHRAYRSMVKSKADFKYNLGEALGGCNYVISRVTPDFILLPEIYLQKGIIYSLQGQDALAAAEYLKAINSDQSLVKAYVGMAEFFIKKNDKKKGLEIITKGLQNNPESKALKRMYKELGGNMPYPAPSAPTPVARVEQPVVDSEATVPAPVAEPSRPRDKVEKQEAMGAEINSPVAGYREIGSPTNPWCRFCTDTPAAPPASSPSTPGVVPRDWK
ncbi:MAG: hypothetical protein Q8O33_12390 [Pseudomonadota bacterium]|nr:hypothetical protein [Pseudomonadota bacterium]